MFLKRFNIIDWIRSLISKVRNKNKPSQNQMVAHEDEHSHNEDNQLNDSMAQDENSVQMQSRKFPPSSRFRSSYQVVDSDGWTTIRFLDEGSECDSDEIRPLILEKPPVLPQFVKKVRAVTHMADHTFIPVEENTIPLIDMDSSTYLMDIAGISGIQFSDEERVARPVVKKCQIGGDESMGESEVQVEVDKRSRRILSNPAEQESSSSDSSDPSVISYLQRKYEKRAERRRKYEALHELRVRVSQRLYNRVPSSYSSLTSDGGDFELNLPSKFYRNIGLTSKRRDEERRQKAYCWLTTLRQFQQDPIEYVIQTKKNVQKFRKEHINSKMFRMGR